MIKKMDRGINKWLDGGVGEKIDEEWVERKGKIGGWLNAEISG